MSNHINNLSFNDIAQMGEVSKQNGKVKAFVDLFLQWGKNVHDKAADLELQLAKRNRCDPFDALQCLREKGLTVAVHNDYRLHGKRHTFWLMIDESTGMSYKGEGTNDFDALMEIAVKYDFTKKDK